MGKSTASNMLGHMGVPVHDSDACVRDVFDTQSGPYFHITAAFPIYDYSDLYEKKTKTLKRSVLAEMVFRDDHKRATLESILHPHVRAEQTRFIAAQQRLGRDMACLDIPLLFEAGAESRVDVTLCVSAPSIIQKQRALARGMSVGDFEARLAAQMPDGDKRKLADFVIPTGLGRAYTYRTLQRILKRLRA